jgi:hypothetical protein
VKTNFGKVSPEISAISPTAGDGKKTNVNLRLPKLEVYETEFIANHEKLGKRFY